MKLIRTVMEGDEIDATVICDRFKMAEEDVHDSCGALDLSGGRSGDTSADSPLPDTSASAFTFKDKVPHRRLKESIDNSGAKSTALTTLKTGSNVTLSASPVR